MRGAMHQEPFYVASLISDAEQGVYAGMISLSGDSKPSGWVRNETGDIALLFAGECRPDRSRLSQLRAAGHEFSDDCGDWIVHEYEESGPSVFSGINGTFTGLLLDSRLRKAFLFCDRYGLTRLYVMETPWGLVFANEAKPLLSVCPESRRFNQGALNEYLAFGFTTGEQTLFQGIKAVQPGSLWTYEHSTLRRGTLFNLDAWTSQPALDKEAFEQSLADTLSSIVPDYFASDERIGISLTGGLDTRLVLAHRHSTARQPVTYTFDCHGCNTLDSQIAARLASACGLPHERVEIDSDFFKNFAAHADRTILATDGCHGVLGSHEIYLNGRARALAPVRLTGVFGGEILRGVSTFKPLEISRDFVPADVRARVHQRACASGAEGEHSVTMAAFSQMPAALYGSLTACRSQVTFRTPFLDNDLVQLAYRAPHSSLRSTDASLRAIQHGNGSLLAVPTDRGKTESRIRQVYLSFTFKLDYLANEGFPSALGFMDDPLFSLGKNLGLLGQHKYLSYRRWLRKELAPFVKERLSDAQLAQLPFLERQKVVQMAHDHIAGKANYTTELNLVLTLQAIDRLLLRGIGSPDHRDEMREQPQALQV